jgi:uncharacterized protein (TIGR02145 family)
MKMLNRIFILQALLATVILVACGDNITTENITQVSLPGMETVANQGELPDCDSLNVGEQMWVKTETTVFVCTDEGWFRSKSTEVPYSCETQKLADETGIKIICNGDSVGVLLNGSFGKNGANGQNATLACSAKQIAGTTFVQVSCQSDTLVFDLNTNPPESSSSLTMESSSEEPPPQSSSSEILESSSSYDEEAVLTSLDSMEGYTQKGPFVQGSNVRLYELSDGRTLKQTNGNFMGVINSNDGFFKISARNLVSQYALLVANGYYRNEVTGKTTTEDLTLFALTDVSERSRANVNLLTHLEYDRVYYLVTKEKMRVYAAKRRAQAEILRVFHVDTTGIGASEDLAVFGNGKGNSALLALSVMLQGRRSIAELTELLSDISADLEKDGDLDTTLKMKIADGAVKLLPFLPRIRANVEGWNLGEVPEFESVIKNFVSSVYGFGVCSADNNGTKTLLQNEKSELNGFYLACENGNWRIKMTDPKTGAYYNVAFIGKQVWMAEDLVMENPYNPGQLKYELNGYDILDSMSLEKGLTQGVCPDGWHIPTFKEWEDQLMAVWPETTLEEAIQEYGGWYGGHGLFVPAWVDARLKATEGWFEDGNGTDDFGFAVKPAYTHYETTPDEIYYSIIYFSSSFVHEEEYGNAISIRYRGFYNDGSTMSGTSSWLSNLYHVRCLRDY